MSRRITLQYPKKEDIHVMAAGRGESHFFMTALYVGRVTEPMTSFTFQTERFIYLEERMSTWCRRTSVRNMNTNEKWLLVLEGYCPSEKSTRGQQCVESSIVSGSHSIKQSRLYACVQTARHCTL